MTLLREEQACSSSSSNRLESCSVVLPLRRMGLRRGDRSNSEPLRWPTATPSAGAGEAKGFAVDAGRGVLGGRPPRRLDPAAQAARADAGLGEVVGAALVPHKAKAARAWLCWVAMGGEGGGQASVSASCRQKNLSRAPSPRGCHQWLRSKVARWLERAWGGDRAGGQRRPGRLPAGGGGPWRRGRGRLPASGGGSGRRGRGRLPAGGGCPLLSGGHSRGGSGRGSAAGAAAGGEGARRGFGDSRGNALQRSAACTPHHITPGTRGTRMPCMLRFMHPCIHADPAPLLAGCSGTRAPTHRPTWERARAVACGRGAGGCQQSAPEARGLGWLAGGAGREGAYAPGRPRSRWPPPSRWPRPGQKRLRRRWPGWRPACRRRRGRGHRSTPWLRLGPAGGWVGGWGRGRTHSSQWGSAAGRQFSRTGETIQRTALPPCIHEIHA